MLPFLGIMTGEYKLGMVSEWMVNGNINDYIKKDPEADPFELVRSHFPCLSQGLLMITSGSSNKLLVD